ncbi:hypothetical protein [uncultured Mesotoga sp.]|mgnify:CR=1 FL=1|uniref:O-antigen ligase family protein n=1 Tax=uncultured Mesotoga sp. TaxID=1184400 RepID=UPI0025919C46|nr:hypothetical protein [uncultured Mesotoga sp.]
MGKSAAQSQFQSDDAACMGHSHISGISHTILLFIVILSIIKPHPSAVSPWIATFGIDLVIITLSLMVFLLKKRVSFKYSLVKVVGFQLTGLLLLLITGYISTLGISGHADSDIIPNFLRMSYYLLLLGLYYESFASYTLNRNIMDKVISITYQVNIVICLLQLFNPPVLGPAVRYVFGEVKLRALATGYPRVYGSFFNANWFGVYLVFLIAWWITSYETDKSFKRARLFSRILSCMALIILTGSRTALLGAIIVLLCYTLLMKKFKLLVVLTGIGYGSMRILDGVAASNMGIARSAARFTALFESFGEQSLADISSFAGRTAAWQIALEEMREISGAFAFGIGGYKTADSTYIKFLVMSGVLGIVSFVCVFVVPTLIASLGKSTSQARVLLLFSIALLVMMITAELFFATQVMNLWIFLLSAALAEQKELCGSDF